MSSGFSGIVGGGSSSGPNLLFSGYSTSTPVASTELIYDLAVKEYENTEYLSAAADGTITFNKSGYYRINYQGITALDGKIYVLAYKNSTNIGTNQYYQSGGYYTSVIYDVSWPFEVGTTCKLALRIYSGTGNAWLAGGPPDFQSRLQISKE
jgi:hypothetical protein